MNTALKKIIILAACFIASGVFADEDQLTVEERLYGLSTLWKEASYNFAYFDQVSNLNWDDVYQSYIPQVIEPQSNYEYYRTLTKFLAGLNDGMTYVEMSADMVKKNVAHPSIKLAEAGREAIVVGVSKELAKKIPLGSIITHVDSVIVEDVLRDEVFPYISSSTDHIRWHEGIRGNSKLGYGLLMGPRESNVNIRYKTLSGVIGELDLKRSDDLDTKNWLFASGIVKNDNSIEHKNLDGNISYVALNNFTDMDISKRFNLLIPKLQSSSALILDLRNNRGGNTMLAEEILKHLTFHDLEGTRTKMRVHNSTYKAWGKYSTQFAWAKKYEPYFSGNAWQENEPDKIFADDVTFENKVVVPTVVLISRETSAAAESFLVYASSASHIILVGEPTFGSTGQPLDIELPGGGFAKICTKRETFADGRDFVGYGIQPDILVKRDVAFFTANVDKTLFTAKDWLSKKLSNNVFIAAKTSK
ncbi:hypothetical protein CJF42_02615 [Pseudoalteromonas sp. NBT06-2]|uniref:S41 family peptidase n=1 Tax=Pseudoalteromonas sp. NBT06-2 TaxID=2025950 RepID=UPI000BA4EF0A|nr:S41 family peptidase [Pseudoalteromonas sp. NBT06-2]PAJ75933.1 hypothetical protein CJF42_02615 [Pseudoalteromonas sp. NBT06-2]